jgi:hypothetical protein
MLIEGVDYMYTFPENDPKSIHIKLLSGVYADTVYKYGKVKFKEENEQVYLIFGYDVIESTVEKPKKLEKDVDFKNYIGNLLADIMLSNIEQEVIDETGTNDSEESN